MFKFFKKKERPDEVPLPPPEFKRPLQEPLSITVPLPSPSLPELPQSLAPSSAEPVQQPTPPESPNPAEWPSGDLSQTASADLIFPSSSENMLPLQSPIEKIAPQIPMRENMLTEEMPDPTPPAADIMMPIKEEAKETLPFTPEISQPEKATIDEDFTLPDFDDSEPTEEPIQELPSFEDIPQTPKMKIFIRAFDYLRIMTEKKRITSVVGQTYKQTEDLTRIASDQNDLYEQWYGLLNTCQEKLIHIDTNLFEQVRT